MPSRSHAIGVLVCAVVATVTALLVVLTWETRSAPEIVIEDAPSTIDIAVLVEGAVNAPGVYRLSGDARLIEAIEAAGGLRDDADSTALNLAARVTDEQQIVIPSLTAVGASPAPSESMSIAANGAIDINTADVAALDALPGIGPVIAQRIIDYRSDFGPFARVEELARVDGISAEMVRELGDRITVGS